MLISALGTVSFASGSVVAGITNQGGYKTTGFLIPSVTGGSGTYKVEWLMADDPGAPENMWENIESVNMGVINSDGTFNRAAYRSSPQPFVAANKLTANAYLALGHSTRGKYVRYKLTPVDSTSKEETGDPIWSEVTPQPIEFVHNMLNNGDFEIITSKNYPFGHEGGFPGSGFTGAIISDPDNDGNHIYQLDGTSKAHNSQAFTMYTSEPFEVGMRYVATLDAKPDYEEDVEMTGRLLIQSDGGISPYQVDVATNSKEWTTISLNFSPTKKNTYGYLGLRKVWGDTTTSGKWVVDNMTLTEALPWATNLKVAGSPKVGSTLVASYTFNEFNAGAEQDSAYKWLKADNPWGPWEVITEGLTTADNKPKLTITEDLQNKYIRFSITPQDNFALIGLEQQTTEKLLVETADIISGGDITGDTTQAGNTISASVDFTNKKDTPRYITTVLAVYKRVNGAEKLTQIKTDTKEVDPEETETLAPSISVEEQSVDGTARVYVLEGSTFDKLIPLQYDKTNSGAKNVSNNEHGVSVDNNKAIANIVSATENMNSLYSVVVVKDGVTLATATPEDIVYFGQGTSNSDDGSYQHSLSVSGAENETAFDAVVTDDFGNQDKSITFTFYGQKAVDDVAVAVDAVINEAIASDDTAAAIATIKAWLSGETLVDGKYDMADILEIDTADYEALTGRGKDIAIAEVVEAGPYEGSTSNLRKAIEAAAEERLASEEWMQTVYTSIQAIKNATPATLETVLKANNTIYNFDLTNKYGFKVDLSDADKTTFMTKIKDSVVAAAADLKINTDETPSDDDVEDFEDAIEAMRTAFAKEVALQAVNFGPADKMGDILLAQNEHLVVDLYGTYAALVGDQKTELYKAIAEASFEGIADFQTQFPLMINTVAEKPFAYDVKLILDKPNQSFPGTGVSVGWEYKDAVFGEEQGEAEITWYAAENNTDEGVQIGTGKSITLTDNEIGKYIYAVVVPVTKNTNRKGIQAFSNRVICSVLSVSNLSFKVIGGLKTTGFLEPAKYTYNGTFKEANSKLEWVMADDPDAPIEMWEKIDSPNAYNYDSSGKEGAANYRRSPLNFVTADTVKANGYLPLNQSTRGKYIAFKITPCDEMGNEGVPVLSPATEAPIEFVRNLINNGDFELGSGYGHNFTLSPSEIAATNSDVAGGDGGQYAMSINGEGKKSATDIAGKGGTPTNNSGDGLFQIFTSGLYTPGMSYTATADVKLDYEDTDVTQSVSFLHVANDFNYTYTMNPATSKEWTTISHSFAAGGVAWYSNFSFRAFGNASDTRIKGAGKWLIDNIGLYTNVPWATNLDIKGNARVGSTLTASYDFNKITDVGSEFESPYKWLKSDYPWGPWEVIEEGVTTAADKPSLAVTADLENKYIRFSVTPREDTVPNLGLEMQTTTKLLVAPTDTITGGTITGDTTVAGNTVSTAVDFTNRQGVDRDITTVIAVYKTVKGAEKLTAITKETKSIAAGETASFAPSLTVDAASVGGVAKIYVLEGSTFDKLIPLQRIENDGAEKASLDDNRAFADNDNATAQIISKTNNEDVTYSVVIVKDGVDPKTATFADIIYFGQGISNADDGSYQHTFSIDGAESEQVFDAVVTYDNGVQNKGITFTYYGKDVAYDIAYAVDEADKAEIRDYFDESDPVLINGNKIDTVLEINMSDYNALTEIGKNMVVDEIIAGKKYEGNIGKIREILETKAAERIKDENWMNEVDAAITAIEGATTDTLAEVLATHNDVEGFGYDLTNEYGFAINLNKENKATFMNAVKASVLAAQSLELNPNADVKAQFGAGVVSMKTAFDNEVALQSVNLGAWEDMALILAAQNAQLGVDLAGAYANLSANQKTQLHMSIFADTFTSIADFQTKFPTLVATAAAIKDPVPETPGLGGGGGGGGGAGGGGGGGTPSPSFGGNFADSSDTNESAGGQGAASAGGFKDVKNSHWAANYIEECSKMGIIKGYEDGSFAPEASITRAEFLAIMLRTLGISADDEIELSFADVPQNEWFFDIVKTATAKGIVTGSSATAFNPNNKISREEMAVMAYRAINAANLSLGANKQSKGQTFTDAESISSFATESIKNLTGLGIINGMGDGTFAPKKAVTRAMAAKIAYELLKIS